MGRRRRPQNKEKMGMEKKKLVTRGKPRECAVSLFCIFTWGWEQQEYGRRSLHFHARDNSPFPCKILYDASVIHLEMPSTPNRASRTSRVEERTQLLDQQVEF